MLPQRRRHAPPAAAAASRWHPCMPGRGSGKWARKTQTDKLSARQAQPQGMRRGMRKRLYLFSALIICCALGELSILRKAKCMWLRMVAPMNSLVPDAGTGGMCPCPSHYRHCLLVAALCTSPHAYSPVELLEALGPQKLIPAAAAAGLQKG